MGRNHWQGFEPLESPDEYPQYDSAGSDPKDGGDSLPAPRWVGHLRSCDQTEHPRSDDGDAAEDEDGFDEDSHSRGTCRTIGGQCLALKSRITAGRLRQRPFARLSL